MFLAFIGVLCLVASAMMAAYAYYYRRDYLDTRDALRRAEEEKRIIIDFLHKVTEDIGSGITREELFEKIVRTTALSCGAMSACVYEKTPDGKLKAAAVEGLFPPQSRIVGAQKGGELRASFLENADAHETLECGEGIIGSVAESGRGILVRNASEDGRVVRHEDDSLKISSIMAVPVIFRGETMGVLAVANPISGKSFSQTDFSLARSLGEQAGLALQNIDSISAIITKKKLEFDLRLASSVQRYLLPQHFPHVDGVDYAVKYYPQQLIGGDFYDLFELPDGRRAAVIADVSGKGISAAIIMAICQTRLQYIAKTKTTPAETLKELNAQMVKLMRADMFVSIIYAIFAPQMDSITMARAGHEPPVLYRASGKRAELVKSSGMAVGLVEPEIFDESIEDKTFALGDGDEFVLYTDGVTESANRNGEEYSAQRLCRTVERLSDLDAAQMTDKLIENLEEFSENNLKFSDDLTLLCIKKTKKTGIDNAGSR